MMDEWHDREAGSSIKFVAVSQPKFMDIRIDFLICNEFLEL